MKKSEVLRAWGRILAGRAPSLSIEITKECPLRCPGCYAFDAAHLGGSALLRELSDFKGEELVRRVLALVDHHKPVHLSLVGGDPMVRYRELEQLIPELDRRGVHTQIVTSAFRVIPAEWTRWKRLYMVVSIDGLPAEHDVRRKPATYERILKNIEHARITVHCTITSQIAGRPGYLDEFLAFWTRRAQVARVWFSLFTPQRGAADAEILSPSARASVLEDLRQLRRKYAKLEMPEVLLRELDHPPENPSECIFARTTATISADLKTRITPCQFGGDPDCRQCGCIASMALAAVGHHPVLGALNAGHLFGASDRVGKALNRMRTLMAPAVSAPHAMSPFKILEP
jgi:MoaA/NifB/PqqE/SkfB family radical SAM enzyme